MNNPFSVVMLALGIEASIGCALISAIGMSEIMSEASLFPLHQVAGLFIFLVSVVCSGIVTMIWVSGIREMEEQYKLKMETTGQ
jgi:hypothetical protein